MLEVVKITGHEGKKFIYQLPVKWFFNVAG